MLRVIVNPIAGHGRSLKLLPEVCEALQKRNLDHEVVQSEYAGHAIELARESQNAEALVVMGGDGTLSEVVNGITDRDITIYFVPCGTGNDFVKTLKLPKNPLSALQLQLDSPMLRIDLPRVNDHAYINVAGTGFDIEVLRQTERYKHRFSGLLAYLCGLVQAIRHFKPIQARVTIDGVTEALMLTIIEVANGQYIGGGMRVAPDANPCDGELDVVYVDALKKWQICLLLPLFITGWFIHLPCTHVRRVNALTLESDCLTMDIDGELIEMEKAQFSIMPGLIASHCPVLASKKATVVTTSA